MNSPVTRERYSTRLRYFLSKIGLTNASIEELCRIFIEKGKQDPNWIVDNIVAFLMEYRGRFDRREISGPTIRNLSRQSSFSVRRTMLDGFSI